jgi:hypothetical protein
MGGAIRSPSIASSIRSAIISARPRRASALFGCAILSAMDLRI